MAGHARARLSAGYAAPRMSEKRKKAEGSGPGTYFVTGYPGFIGTVAIRTPIRLTV